MFWWDTLLREEVVVFLPFLGKKLMWVVKLSSSGFDTAGSVWYCHSAG